MKRQKQQTLSSLLSVFLMLIVMVVLAGGYSTTVHAEEPDVYITDAAQILTDSEWDTLDTKARTISETYQCSVYVVTTENYQEYGSSIEDVCRAVYEEVLPGYGEGRDAIVMLLSMKERDYWIEDFGEFGRYALTDYGRNTLERAIKREFKKDHWAEGISKYLDQSEAILKAARDGKPLNQPLGKRIFKAYGIALLVSLIAAWIICGRFKAQMKTAVKATTAEAYVAETGADIQVRDEQYINTTRTQRKIERKQSSGGNSSGGGGKF